MQIAVIGSSETQNQEALAEAYEVGTLLADKEAKLVCGGLGGIMSEASRGAFERGGDVIAVLPGLDATEANPWVTHVVTTGTSHARNLAVVASAASLIAIDGSWGTLSEIAFARRLEKSVICLNKWIIEIPSGEEAGLFTANSPGEAVSLAIQEATKDLNKHKNR